MDREHAICNYVVANDETLVVSDIERDPRFAETRRSSNGTCAFTPARRYAQPTV